MWRVGINLIIFGGERKCDRFILTHWWVRMEGDLKTGAPAESVVIPAQDSFAGHIIDEYLL